MENFLTKKDSRFTTEQLEEAMQTVMDSYAGGIKTNYRFNEKQLDIADYKIKQLTRTFRYSYMQKIFRSLCISMSLGKDLRFAEVYIAHLKGKKRNPLA